MVPTDVLASATAALLVLWAVVAAWIVGARVRDDRLRRQRGLDARRLAGAGDPALLSRRRLVRLADAEPGPGASAAARELVRRESPRLIRRAQRRAYGRTHALRVLARGESPVAYGLLRAARRRGSADVRRAVVAIAAEQQTPAADELLLDILADGDHPRSRTATELAPRAPRLVPYLLALGAHPEADVRYWAVMLLREAAADPRAKAAAVEALTDTAGTVRGAAARVLGACGASDVQPLLRALLADEVFFVRAHAARAAGDIGAHALAREIAALLADRSWWVRAAAKESLLVLGAAGHAAASSMLSADDAFARDGAAEVVSAFEREPQALVAAG